MITDGALKNNKAWFGFDLIELRWLYELIPDTDEFKKTVAKAIIELEKKTDIRK